jgi:abortive infection bacteriophage resistance protein
MPFPQVPPHRDLDRQIIRLQQRGMVIGDLARAKLELQRIGYYRLCEYWYIFRVRQTGLEPSKDFNAGTRIEDALELYEFDRKLRLLFLDAIERIEVALRSEISSLLGSRHAHAHLEPMELDPLLKKSTYQEWLDAFQKSYERKRNKLRRFIEEYSEPLPIWIATHTWEFGTLSKFFRGMHPADRTRIAEKFGIKRAALLVDWLALINELRNVCAHHEKLWNRVPAYKPAFHAIGEIPPLDHLLDPAPKHEYARFGRIYGATGRPRGARLA